MTGLSPKLLISSSLSQGRGEEKRPTENEFCFRGKVSGSPEKQKQQSQPLSVSVSAPNLLFIYYKYIDLLCGIGSCDYGGREVSQSAVCESRDPGEPVVSSSLRPVNPRNRWCKQEKTSVPADQSGRQTEKSPFLHLFVLFGTEFCLFCLIQQIHEAHPHRGGRSAFISAWIQMLICSGNTFTDTAKITFNQMSGHLVTQSG